MKLEDGGEGKIGVLKHPSMLRQCCAYVIPARDGSPS